MESIFEGDGILLLSMCDWRWEMGIMFVFGMIRGVEIGLSLYYPVLYTLARFPNAWVVNNLSVVDEVAHWNVVFMRYAQD